jgi:hypothetical protein
MKAHRQQHQVVSSSLSVAAAMKSQREVVTEGATAAAAAHDHPLATTLANQEVTFLSSAAKSSQPYQDKATVDLANLASIAKRKLSMVEGKPDIGILSKHFMNNKGREQSIDKQLAIYRKKRAAADVDVGILGNGRRRQASRANLHVMNEVTGRSLQSEGYLPFLPYMCADKNGYGGSFYFDRLFDKTDGYFPKCSCPNPTTCGPDLCECLELDADGDILQCMDPFKQLCEGTKYISRIPGPWSFEECIGVKLLATSYCSMLPCFADGGSYWQCACNRYDRECTEFRYTNYCAISKCCQAQTDDEGREACMNGDLYVNYDEYSSFSIPEEEVISRFNECSFNSGDDKSIVQCYCESFSYGLCVNYGFFYPQPEICEAMNCCFEQTEDDSRLDCFTAQFRHGATGYQFHRLRDELQESCVASGKSSDQCKCDIQGLSNCVRGIWNGTQHEPRCDLFECCQSQRDDNDDGRNDCLVQDEIQSRYIECINVGNTTESSCLCDKSNILCIFGHSNDRQCELSSCCQEQADDTGRKECIGNFTTSQPSSAPRETPAKDSIDEAGASTAASASPSTSGVSISTHVDTKSLTKTRMLAAATVIGWLIFT